MSIDLENLRTDYAYQIEGQEASAALAEFERRAHARSVVVPTDDLKVKARLRELGEPIILFGEGPGDRRDRLRYLLSLGDRSTITAGKTSAQGADDDGEGAQEEEYYTLGSEELLQARRKIAQYSLIRARDRVARQRVEAAGDPPLSRLIAHRKSQNARLRTFVSQGSQIAADRPVSIARFSPDGRIIATGSWAGDVRCFNALDLHETRRITTGHTDKVSGLDWHPRATLSLSSDLCNLATGGGEGDVCLWSLPLPASSSSPSSADPVATASSSPLATLRGHGGRVGRVKFHPSGQFLASASFDGTWRLWDVPTTTQLLLQQGHAHEVYCLAHHPDGNLLGTGGLDAVGRVWDLRSGKTVMVLDGHVRPIHGIDFSGNGHHVATGGADDTLQIWDLRKVGRVANVPAHRSAISDVSFFHASPETTTATTTITATSSAEYRAGGGNDSSGEGADIDMTGTDKEIEDGKRTTTTTEIRSDGTFLVTSGYDGAVNVWNADDWSLVKSLVGPADKKVMSVDVSGDGQAICSSGFDRTLRLWASDAN